MDDRPWHTMDAADVAAALGTDVEEGLHRAEARHRQARYGLNKLRQARRVSALKILYDQFTSLVVLLLAVASAISFGIGDHVEAASIAVVILLNAGIGFVVELRANRAMESLQKLGVQETVVIRDGARDEIGAQDLVPGDVVEFEAGDSITADCRLAEASELRIVEAPLTGESVPVSKRVERLADTAAPLGDRVNMLYKGTTAVTGSARAVVVATGMSTEVGRIAELISKAEDEATPLELRLHRLGRSLVFIVMAIAAIVIAAGIARGKSVGTMLTTGIALAIAAVPEGLPAVATISLAVGMQRMARRNALIRRLPAVETLGSASVICTDKTGTLTENEMTAVRYELAGGSVDVTGTGYDPVGEFRRGGARIDPKDCEPLRLALVCGALCNNASLGRDEQTRQWDITGDPTEGALVVAAAKAGLDQEELRDRNPQAREHPFSSHEARMATVHRWGGAGLATFVKGSPGRVFDACTRVLTAGGEQPFDAFWRGFFDTAVERMAGDALRVLALAWKTIPADEPPYGNLSLLGLVGLLDPPREEVAGAIVRFREAGIRTVMITGDHPRTAQAIARMLNIVKSGDDHVVAGRELHEMTEEALAAEVDGIGVYARVSPEDKVKIVDALQDKGNVVAMLGDGVNDAAALKAADIGVAMGIQGTDVAKETSDIVLLDDRFVTVAAAVEQGRVVLANIQKFIHYLFSCNLSEILTVFIGTISGLPLPLLPLQILWLNLITDVFPALSLAVEPAEGDLMKRPPRPLDKPIFSARIRRSVVGYAILITAVSLGAYFWALHVALGRRGGDQGLLTARLPQTATFMTIALAQLFHAWTSRKEHGPIQSLKEAASNPWMIASAVLTIGLQLLAIYLPGLNSVLHTVPLTGYELLMVFAFGLVPLAVGQAIRWVWLRTR